MKTGASGDKRFEMWLTSRLENRVTKQVVKAKVVMEELKQELIHTGPIYTGASTGIPGPHPIKPSHPAYGLNIGNEPGDSGWQIGETARRLGKPVRIYLKNPMWHYYLKYVEAGVAPHQVSKPGFVRDAWMRIVRSKYV